MEMDAEPLFTMSGTAGQVLLGLTGLDVVTDLRDLSYDLTHFREAGLVQTLLDAVGLIPGLGILKNADEVVTLLKNALPQLMPYADEMATVLRQAFRGGSPALSALAGSTRYADDLAEAGQTARRADDLAEAAANGKYVDEVAESGKYLSGPGKQSTEWADADRMEAQNAAGQFPLVHDLAQNPRRLGSFTPETLMEALRDDGMEVKPLSGGALKGVSFEQGGGYKVNFDDGGLFQYHPAYRSHHDGAYYKISTGKGGTKRYDTAGYEIKD